MAVALLAMPLRAQKVAPSSGPGDRIGGIPSLVGRPSFTGDQLGVQSSMLLPNSDLEQFSRLEVEDEACLPWEVSAVRAQRDRDVSELRCGVGNAGSGSGRTAAAKRSWRCVRAGANHRLELFAVISLLSRDICSQPAVGCSPEPDRRSHWAQSRWGCIRLLLLRNGLLQRPQIGRGRKECIGRCGQRLRE